MISYHLRHELRVIADHLSREGFQGESRNMKRAISLVSSARGEAGGG
jgi:hypothetical protein